MRAYGEDMVKDGDPIPDVALTGPGGEQVSLRAYGGEHTLLIFLRHLA